MVQSSKSQKCRSQSKIAQAGNINQDLICHENSNKGSKTKTSMKHGIDATRKKKQEESESENDTRSSSPSYSESSSSAKKSSSSSSSSPSSKSSHSYSTSSSTTHSYSYTSSERSQPVSAPRLQMVPKSTTSITSTRVQPTTSQSINHDGNDHHNPENQDVMKSLSSSDDNFDDDDFLQHLNDDDDDWKVVEEKATAPTIASVVRKHHKKTKQLAHATTIDQSKDKQSDSKDTAGEFNVLKIADVMRRHKESFRVPKREIVIDEGKEWVMTEPEVPSIAGLVRKHRDKIRAMAKQLGISKSPKLSGLASLVVENKDKIQKLLDQEKMASAAAAKNAVQQATSKKQQQQQQQQQQGQAQERVIQTASTSLQAKTIPDPSSTSATSKVGRMMMLKHKEKLKALAKAKINVATATGEEPKTMNKIESSDDKGTKKEGQSPQQQVRSPGSSNQLQSPRTIAQSTNLQTSLQGMNHVPTSPAARRGSKFDEAIKELAAQLQAEGDQAEDNVGTVGLRPRPLSPSSSSSSSSQLLKSRSFAIEKAMSKGVPSNQYQQKKESGATDGHLEEHPQPTLTAALRNSSNNDKPAPPSKLAPFLKTTNSKPAAKPRFTFASLVKENKQRILEMARQQQQEEQERQANLGTKPKEAWQFQDPMSAPSIATVVLAHQQRSPTGKKAVLNQLGIGTISQKRTLASLIRKNRIQILAMATAQQEEEEKRAAQSKEKAKEGDGNASKHDDWKIQEPDQFPSIATLVLANKAKDLAQTKKQMEQKKEKSTGSKNDSKSSKKTRHSHRKMPVPHIVMVKPMDDDDSTSKNSSKDSKRNSKNVRNAEHGKWGNIEKSIHSSQPLPTVQKSSRQLQLPYETIEEMARQIVLNSSYTNAGPNTTKDHNIEPRNDQTSNLPLRAIGRTTADLLDEHKSKIKQIAVEYSIDVAVELSIALARQQLQEERNTKSKLLPGHDLFESPPWKPRTTVDNLPFKISQQVASPKNGESKDMEQKFQRTFAMLSLTHNAIDEEMGEEKKEMDSKNDPTWCNVTPLQKTRKRKNELHVTSSTKHVTTLGIEEALAGLSAWHDPDLLHLDATTMDRQCSSSLSIASRRQRSWAIRTVASKNNDEWSMLQELQSPSLTCRSSPLKPDPPEVTGIPIGPNPIGLTISASSAQQQQYQQWVRQQKHRAFQTPINPAPQEKSPLRRTSDPIIMPF